MTKNNKSSKNSKNTKSNTISSTNVFLSAVLWGLTIIACMYIGSFVVSLIGNIVYYGVLLGASIFTIKYFKGKYYDS